jgi:H+/Cl- antiporter ClcA
VAGAAAGMSAVFATPAAAVFLAVELQLFEWKPRSLIPVAVASIVAAALRVPLLGAGPIFAIAPHGLLGANAYLCAAAVGIVAGLASPQSLANGGNLHWRVKKDLGRSCKRFLRLLTEVDVATPPQDREKLRY